MKLCCLSSKNKLLRLSDRLFVTPYMIETIIIGVFIPFAVSTSCDSYTSREFVPHRTMVFLYGRSLRDMTPAKTDMAIMTTTHKYPPRMFLLME